MRCPAVANQSSGIDLLERSAIMSVERRSSIHRSQKQEKSSVEDTHPYNPYSDIKILCSGTYTQLRKKDI
jgi:hypothetical protein